jgi:hypothetical protein
MVGVSVVYNFHTGNNKIKLLTEYENVPQEILFGNAVAAALMSGRKYDVINRNGDCSSESNLRSLVLRNRVPLSRRNAVTELNVAKITLQAVLSDAVKAISRGW